jgi:Peptidase family M1 domain
MKITLLGLVAAALVSFALAPQAQAQSAPLQPGRFEDKFRQLDPEDLPTPNAVRPATGAPGPAYWQQKVDYKIDVTLNEATKSLTGTAQVRYRNNAPEALPYLWFLLDQNNFKRTSLAERSRTTSETGRISFDEVRRARMMRDTEAGFTIKSVVDASGKALVHDVVDTLMRIDLPQPLKSGEEVVFTIAWDVPFVDSRLMRARSGYECFEKAGEDGNCIFLAAQWFPRAAAYSDFEGWHNMPFLGSGEFTLEFGDYEVAITTPADFVVSSTGVLQNEADVLSPTQRQRLASARTTTGQPLYVVTPAEAAAAERTRASGVKTWRFAAENVRDFAFAGSRKFIWDAMAVKQPGGPDVLAMSFFPKEGDPLWSAYSTKSIAHTIDVYGRMTFAYPYPTAQSVNGPVGGMEYPMITFNGPRPEKDDKGNLTYSDRTKYGLISVIIHEVGHIWFPMIVNSDERQWTWMDEGLNTFLQYVTEQEWSAGYPSRRGDPRDIVEYMRSEGQMPIMTQSDAIGAAQFGANAYGKPATALVILRETILGPERFDRAFKEFAVNWRFKRPTPADFFRAMEESSGFDLDWFWRGWFYSTDNVDIAITNVREGTIDTQDPDVEAPRRIAARDAAPVELREERNRGVDTVVQRDPRTRDYYDRTDPLAATKADRERYQASQRALTPEERAVLSGPERFYIVSLANRGGLVMPVILKFTFKDGTSDTARVPAVVWRRTPRQVNWTYMTTKEVVSVELDPRFETADVERANNHFPPRIEPTRLQVFKDAQTGRNQMKDDALTVTPDSLDTKPAATSAPAGQRRP